MYHPHHVVIDTAAALCIHQLLATYIILRVSLILMDGSFSILLTTLKSLLNGQDFA